MRVLRRFGGMEAVVERMLSWSGCCVKGWASEVAWQMLSPQERVNLIETKETQLDEIRQMLRAMQPATGLTLVDDQDQVTTTAWIFVALNVIVALYLLQSVVVAPLTSVTSI